MAVVGTYYSVMIMMLNVVYFSSSNIADEKEGVLDRPSCLAALAALRHTKWFQVCKMLVCLYAHAAWQDDGWMGG